MTNVDALVIGCGQALAIVPGISRAGATMATGMARGLSRTAAARFSFLLSIPAIAGAGLLELRDYEPDSFGGYSTLDVAIGSVSAALAGLWAIRFLLRLVATDADWSHGEGTDDVRGPSGELLLAATGRSTGLDGLEGPGVATLAGRL